MKLPSRIKGWFNVTATISPETLLLNYAATGNRQYLQILVAEFNLSLYHYLLSHIDKSNAEDILQNTWLKVVNSAASFQQGSSVKSWLYTIARHLLIDELRRQKRWQLSEFDEVHDDLAEQSANNVEQTLTDKEQLILFNQLIAKLPFLQRECFILQQDGFSLLEISELTQENIETVKSRLRYARNYLKSKLGSIK